MSSYLAPQVDHNLYNPVLPQTNVAEIFQLMGAKQQMYNSNLAKINSTLSSMNDLSNSVTNENIKNKVNEFNKSANEAIKKYSNLDFSISDNVKAIDNVYTPLLKDQDFITDFSSTSHLNNQMQVGFSKRDSDKKEERDEFSMTNLAYVSNGFNDLRDAKNSKELKLAAGNARQRVYVPYVDYGQELEDSLIKLEAKVSYDKASGGYIVTTKDGVTGQTYTQGIQKFLDLTLSDKARQQIKIESQVSVDNLIRTQGIEKITTDYIQGSIDRNDNLKDKYSKELEDLTTQLNVLPDDIDRMSKKQKETYSVLQDKIELTNKNLSTLDAKSKEIRNISNKMQDGTFNYSDFSNMLASELASDKVNSLTGGLAASYSETHADFSIKEDTAFSHKQDLGFRYSELEQRKLEHRDENYWKEKGLKLEYDKIEADLVKVGLKLNGDKTSIVPVEGATTNEVASSTGYNAIVDLENANNFENSKVAHAEYVKLYKSTHNGQEPPANSRQEAEFANPNVKLDSKHWDQRYIDAKKSIFKQKGTSVDDKEVLRNYLQEAFTEYNKTHKGAKIGFDKGGKITDNFTTEVYNFRQKYEDIKNGKSTLETTKYKSREEAEAFRSYAMTNDMGRMQIDKNPKLLKNKNTKYIEDFDAWLLKPKEMGGYSRKLAIPVQSTLFSRGDNSETLYKTIEPTTVSWVNSHPVTRVDEDRPNNSVKELLKLNPQYKNAEQLEAAYGEFIKQSRGTKFQPTMQAGNREKGTNFVLNSEKPDSKASEDIKTGLSILGTSGINLPVAHKYYTEVSKTKSVIESGKEVTIDGFSFYKDSYGDKKYPYKAYPKAGNHHYLYEGNYEIKQTQSGYEVKPLKTAIPIDATTMQQFYDNGLSNLTSSIDENVNKVESNLFEKKLTEYITKNPSALKVDGNKTYVEPTVIATILKTIKIK